MKNFVKNNWLWITCICAFVFGVLHTAESQVVSGGGSGSSSGAAPGIGSATTVTITPAAGTVDGSGKTLAEIATGSAASYMVREIIIDADPENSDKVGIRKGTLGVIFRQLSAGNEWVLTAPAGSAFDANTLKAVAISGSQTVAVIAIR